MNVLEAARRRRSVRRYQDRPLEPEVVGRLEEAMLRSASSRGLRPWRFVFVTGRERLLALSRAKSRWADFLAGAALGVAICGDESVSDAWVEDCSIAATMLMLAAADEGVGSCWVQIRDRQTPDGGSSEAYVREVLGLPEELRVLCVMSLGYPAEETRETPADKLKREAVTRL